MLAPAVIVLTLACGQPDSPDSGAAAVGGDGGSSSDGAAGDGGGSGWPDADGDGFTTYDDCDDNNASVHPGAEEVCGNDLDDDCDGGAPGCGMVGTMRYHDATVRVRSKAKTQLGTYVGAPGDVTGDGLDDLLVGDSTGGRSWLLAGPLRGKVELNEAVARIGARGASLMGPARDEFDFDGDGVHDVAVGGRGPLYLWLGPVSGELTPANADVVMATGGSAPLDTTDVTSLGDIDGDGHDDLFIDDPTGWYCEPGTDECGEGGGVGFLVLGQSASEIDLLEAPLVLAGSADMSLRMGAVGPGDLDGDGLDDLAIPVDGGAVQIVFGPLSELGVIGASDAELVNTRAATTGRLSEVGDIDGDGTAELGIAFDEMGPKSVAVIAVVPGAGTHGVDDVALFSAYMTERGVDHTTSLDADNDGERDFVMGGRHLDLGRHDRGGAAVFYGPLSGTVSLRDSDAVIYGPWRNSELAASMQLAGDVDADGYDDVILGAAGDFRGTEGAVFVFGGGPGL